MCLMSRRRKEDYISVLQAILELTPETKLLLNGPRSLGRDHRGPTSLHTNECPLVR